MLLTFWIFCVMRNLKIGVCTRREKIRRPDENSSWLCIKSWQENKGMEKFKQYWTQNKIKLEILDASSISRLTIFHRNEQIYYFKKVTVLFLGVESLFYVNAENAYTNNVLKRISKSCKRFFQRRLNPISQRCDCANFYQKHKII